MSITQRITDGTLLLDTGNANSALDVAPSATTLAAAITTTTQTAITLTSGAGVVDGAYILCETEPMLVETHTGGAVVVQRDPAIAVTHLNGATVDLPGSWTVNLLPSSQVPNRDLIIRKTSSDINYLAVTAAFGDTFPGGGTVLMLIDAEASGTVHIKFPSTGNVLIPLAGGGGKAGPQGIPGVPGPAGATGTPAPVIATATASAIYGMSGNASTFGFAGIITLPVADPDYAHLAAIAVSARVVGTTGWTPVVSVPQSSFGVSSVGYAGDATQFPQSGIAYWEIQFVPLNESGAPSTALVIPVTVQASAVSSVSGAAEIGTRYVAPEDARTRLVSMTAGFVPVLNGGQVPQVVTYLVGKCAGATWVDGSAVWTWINQQTMKTVGQQITFQQLAPGVDQTWKIAAVAGAQNSVSVTITTANLTTLYPGAVLSSAFSVAGLDLPSATAVTTAAIAAGVSGANPYDKVRPDGTHYVEIPGVTWTDPTDVNAAFMRITVQCVDVSGSPAPPDQGGTEVPFNGPMDAMGDVVQPGCVRSTLPLAFDYNPVGSAYVYMQYRYYEQNRNATSTADWSDPTKSVLETTAWSGAAYKRVLFGPAVPPDLGAGLYPDPVTQLPTVGTVGNPSNMLQNWSFEAGEPTLGYGVPGGPIPGWSVAGNTRQWIGYDHSGVGSLALYGSYGNCSQAFSVKAGDQYYIEVWCADYDNGGGYDGTFATDVQFLDAAGGSLGYQSVGTATSAAHGAWQKLSAVVTAPANSARMVVYAAIVNGATTSYWFVDDCVCRLQLPGGAGIQPNGAGGFELSPAGVAIANFGAGTRPVSIFTTNPALPDANYPPGSFGYNISGTPSFLRVNAAGNAWVKAINGGADIQAGTVTAIEIDATILSAAQVAAAYVTTTYLTTNYLTASTITANYMTATYIAANYASFGYLSANYATIGALNAHTITADKITGGTCAATVSFTAPVITVTGPGSAYVINVDSSNGFLCTGNGIKTSITNGTFGGFPAGLLIQDSGAGTSSTMISNAYLSVSNLFMGNTGTGALQVVGAAGQLLLTTTSGPHSLTLFAGPTYAAASTGSQTLPANPAGFLRITLDGTNVKIPYYNN